MCPMADMCGLRDRPQNGTVEKSGTERVNCDKDYLFEKCSAIKEIETIPARITILHSKNESIILRAEEDPRKPWYFIHV